MSERSLPSGEEAEPLQVAGGTVFLTEPQFSQRYQVPPSTVARWRKEGSGPPFVRFGPKQIRYRLADIEAWIQARTFTDRRAELAQQAAA